MVAVHFCLVFTQLVCLIFNTLQLVQSRFSENDRFWKVLCSSEIFLRVSSSFCIWKGFSVGTVDRPFTNEVKLILALKTGWFSWWRISFWVPSQPFGFLHSPLVSSTKKYNSYGGSEETLEMCVREEIDTRAYIFVWGHETNMSGQKWKAVTGVGTMILYSHVGWKCLQSDWDFLHVGAPTWNKLHVFIIRH